MARIDKWKNGFRAKLAADRPGSVTPIGVGLDANGLVVAGAGQTGVIGVLCDPVTRVAGETVDVMIQGELVEAVGLDAGTTYWADPVTGALEALAATDVQLGSTVEATRLIVNVQNLTALAALSVDTASIQAGAVTKAKLAGGFLKTLLADGTAAATDVNVAGMAVGDELVSVIALTTKAAIATAVDRTSEYAVGAAKLVKAAGTDETNNQLLITYLDLT